jgi:hypothetical protein
MPKDTGRSGILDFQRDSHLDYLCVLETEFRERSVKMF